MERQRRDGNSQAEATGPAGAFVAMGMKHSFLGWRFLVTKLLRVGPGVNHGRR